jgi:hypothetical protein
MNERNEQLESIILFYYILSHRGREHKHKCKNVEYFSFETKYWQSKKDDPMQKMPKVKRIIFIRSFLLTTYVSIEKSHSYKHFVYILGI